MHKLKRRLLLPAITLLASACDSNPPKLQDAGSVVVAPSAPRPTPPVLMPPPPSNFQAEYERLIRALADGFHAKKES